MAIFVPQIKKKPVTYVDDPVRGTQDNATTPVKPPPAPVPDRSDPQPGPPATGEPVLHTQPVPGSATLPSKMDLYTQAHPGTWQDQVTADLQRAGWTDDPNYWIRRITETSGVYDDYWRERIASGPNGQEKYAHSNGVSGGSVFSDPATTEWEQLLRQMVDKLNTPRTNPDYGPLVDYMRNYAATLSGPAYTPDQMDLLQTQALDPLTRERDAQKQRIVEWASAHGQDPNSGPVQQQMRNLDEKFGQLRTKTQADFASNAVGLEKSQDAQALQVLTALAGLQDQTFNSDEQRMMNAVNLFKQVPQLADERLGLANQSLNGSVLNPVSLLQLFNSQQLNQQGLNADFWNQIGQLLATAFS